MSSVQPALSDQTARARVWRSRSADEIAVAREQTLGRREPMRYAESPEFQLNALDDNPFLSE
jgi:hypothetical protein